MVSLTVNNVPNMDEWHLPTYDPSNQQIYHYKLESVDIYFWTHLDALQFVNGVRRVLPPFQVDVQDEPPVPAPPPPPQQPRQVQQVQQVHANSTANMSSVVQKLESVALNGGVAPPPAGIPTFAAPPVSTVSEDAGAQTASPPTQSPPPGVKPVPQPLQHAFAAPFAYNPAAPPAPETIRPREKTPPPEDAPAQHPLHQTLYQDAATPFSPGLIVPAGLGPLSPGIPPPQFQAPPGAPSFPAPPAYTSNPPTPAGLPQQYQQFPTAPQQVHPGISRATTMPVAGSAPSPFNPAASFNSFSPPPATGSAPPPSAAPGSSYSNTSVPATSAAATAGPGANPYLVHQQHYQPQAGEGPNKYQAKQDPRGKLEETAGRLEKGVTGMLKKFEKRFG